MVKPSCSQRRGLLHGAFSGVENLRTTDGSAIARYMAVTRATFARSVTYTVTERGEPSSHTYDTPTRRRREVPGASRARRVQARRATAEAVRPNTERWVECVTCEVEMKVVSSATRDLYYLACPKCGFRFASCYDEVLSARAGVRLRAPGDRPAAEETDRWRALRARAEAFHRRVEESDPYRVLGLETNTPFSEVRAHYHELAGRHHPDHGGDPARMRRIIEAYEKIRVMVAASDEEY